MKKIIIFLFIVLCFSCDSKQRQHEDALLFPDKYKYSFEVTYDIQYFPDVSIYFDFSCNPSKKTLIAIESEFKKFEEKYQKMIVHAITRTEVQSQYLISVNFNRIDFDTYTEFDMNKDIDTFEYLLKSMEENPEIQDLIAIKFK